MHLAPNVYLANIGDRAIVLDLANDRYFAMEGKLAATAKRVMARASSTDHQDLAFADALDELEQRGILTKAGAPVALRHASVASRSLWPTLEGEQRAGPPPVVREMAAALWALTQVSLALRFWSFQRTIAWLARTKGSRRSPRQSSSQQTLVDAFNQVRPFFPIKPICRLDAFALSLYLGRHGYDTDVVFGVRLDPFHAHCWVQSEDTAITQPWAMVRQHTHILVL